MWVLCQIVKHLRWCKLLVSLKEVSFLSIDPFMENKCQVEFCLKPKPDNEMINVL